MGNPFLEWNLAATAFLAEPQLHPKFLSPNPESFKIPGVEYKFGKVVEINPETKTITLESGSPIQGWTALVVATGFKVHREAHCHRHNRRTITSHSPAQRSPHHSSCR